MNGAIFALCLACAHHCFAHFVHHGAYVRKVQVDQTGTNHQVRHTFDTLVQHVICHAEGFGKGCFFICKAEQVLVRNDDQCIDHLLQGGDACFGLAHTFRAFELERLCNNTDGQNPQFTRSLRDDRCGPCTGPTAHTGSDKTHMRTSKVINDLFDAFFGSGCTNFGTRTCAKTFGDFDTQLDARSRQALLKRLCVGICDNKLDAFQLLFDHVVYRVAASAANTKHSDPRFQFVLLRY